VKFYKLLPNFVPLALHWHYKNSGFGKGVDNGLSQDGRPFFMGKIFFPPSGVPCFGGRWRLSATFDRRLTASVHVAEEHRPHPHPAT